MVDGATTPAALATTPAALAATPIVAPTLRVESMATVFQFFVIDPDVQRPQQRIADPQSGGSNSRRSRSSSYEGNSSTPIRKKKIASLAAGRTRRSGRFGRNLLNSDADRHGTVHPDAARHGICLPDGAWQGIFLLDAAVSWHFPSGCSRVRPFSFWTQPCQCIFLQNATVSGKMVSGRCVSWHHGHTGCQGTEHRSKYSRGIRKHAAGSRHSDSVQFYSLYLMYIYICYYHTSRGNRGKLANTARCDEQDALCTTR